MDGAAARDALLHFTQCLDVLGFGERYFVTDGTLLGLVREGGFIAADYDIDFGMWADDYDPALVDALVAAGFEHRETLGKREDGLVVKFRRGAIPVDLSLYYREGDIAWSAVYKRPHEQMRSRFDMFQLEPARMCGVSVCVPSPPERFLRTAYGENWHLPVRNWEYRYGPENLHAHGSWIWKLRYLLGRVVWRLRNRGNHVAGPAET